MSDSTQNSGRGAARLLCALAIAAAALLCLPSLASADYQQIPEHFGEAQLDRALGMAVNEGGEGGVAAGSFYVVGRNRFVLRFGPGEEGEAPPFEEAWGWGVANHAQQYQRCGPAYEGSADPGGEHTYETCGFSVGPYPGEEAPGYFGVLTAVAVDQATGNVYVRNEPSGVRQNHLVEVFTARGAPVGEGFGDQGSEGPPPESIAEGPAKLHYTFATSEAMAVDEAGTVYLNDSDYIGVEPQQARVMSFRPESPGDYEHYVYAGQGNDIVFAHVYEEPERMALVGGDRLVAANQEAIREYPLEAGAPAASCALAVSGQLFAMAANPLTGEVFYLTFADRSIHRLGPCDPETGEFEELQEAVKPSPESE